MWDHNDDVWQFYLYSKKIILQLQGGLELIIIQKQKYWKMDPNLVAVYFRNVSVKLTLSKEKCAT